MTAILGAAFLMACAAIITYALLTIGELVAGAFDVDED